MKKNFTKRLFIYMLAALLVTISAVFVLQTVVSQRNNTSSSIAKLEDVKEKLTSNEENIENLKKNLSEDNLAKTRAFADMIAADRSIIKDTAKLNSIKDRLMVNELHVIDEDGIITESTIDSYVGFDMKSGEQSNAFMVIVDDPGKCGGRSSHAVHRCGEKGCAGTGTGRRTAGSPGKYVGRYGDRCGSGGD